MKYLDIPAGDLNAILSIYLFQVGTLQWTRDGFGLGETRDLIAYSRYKLIGSDEESKYNR